MLCAWKFPELSYLFFAPVLLGLIAALLAMRSLHRASAGAPLPPLSAALPIVGAAFTFIPILLSLYAALGADAWPAITALAGLGALGLAPLLVQTPAHSYRAYAWAGTLIVILGGGVSLLMPAYTSKMPQRTLLWYLLDADTGTATWLLQPDSKRAPPQLALHPAQHPQPLRLPEGTIAVRYDPQPHASTIRRHSCSCWALKSRGSTVLYHLHVRSVRNAPEIELAVAEDRVIEATLEPSAGQKLPAHFWRAAEWQPLAAADRGRRPRVSISPSRPRARPIW